MKLRRKQLFKNRAGPVRDMKIVNKKECRIAMFVPTVLNKHTQNRSTFDPSNVSFEEVSNAIMFLHLDVQQVVSYVTRV